MDGVQWRFSGKMDPGNHIGVNTKETHLYKAIFRRFELHLELAGGPPLFKTGWFFVPQKNWGNDSHFDSYFSTGWLKQQLEYNFMLMVQ